MPTKELFSQTDRKGLQDTFKFGGGANTIFAFGDVVVVVDPEIEDFTLESPYGYIINGGGGNDTIYGSDYTGPPDTSNGGIPDPEFVLETATGDLLIGGDGSDTVIGGAGDDTIYGGNLDGSDKGKGKGGVPTNILVGDGERVDDEDPATADPLSADVNFLNGLDFTGGDDVLNGANASTNNMYGDAVNVTMVAGLTFYGGNDTLNGGDGSTNNMYGDADDVNMVAGSVFNGGGDTLTGGDGSTLNSIFGDADDVTMVAGSTFDGGDDSLTGGDGSTNLMFGDADRLTIAAGSTFNGGDDTLRAGDGGSNTMVGDANIVTPGDGNINGGDDTLFSGTGNDTMVGDWANIDIGFTGTVTRGDDTFVFAQNFGFDSIGDFEVGSDTINLFATELTLFSDLDSNRDSILDGDDLGVTIVVNPITNVSTTQIDFGVVTGETFQGFLTISGVTGLMATDFDFTTDLFV